jgi:hypothetical protein
MHDWLEDIEQDEQKQNDTKIVTKASSKSPLRYSRTKLCKQFTCLALLLPSVLIVYLYVIYLVGFAE